ncbi:branched-chain amino acid ABC transporter permease [Bradyrhizobium sp. KB893862 SZCCT0404]|uniref:branched-chain amino acid ABC transporter permease n=1 Tax=Bradyrhizobium sp. KB893862 SZCCT0404 TaxID=2807672 RepID=UPI001BAC98ED|nr:branched-chain amino acid ABC transporter permease [Bradyrhizobium sp. KB893862 SZCCT0404]MBR1177169.1 branched-chain amino acid ABC transporter permease [Bradyrhizobium sp. KB893862 SZCCT0404]
MNGYFTAAVAGLVAGGTYALLGVCAVFTYRLVAVVDFVGAAIGTAGAFAFAMSAELGLPLWSCTLAGIVVGGVVGGAVGWIMTHWFADAAASTKAAVAVALLVGLAAIGLRITGGQHPHAFPVLFEGSAFRLAGVEITNASLATLILALLFTLGADLFLSRSHVGLQLRALSERPMAAELIGIPVRNLSLCVWVVGGAATAFALILIAPQRAPNFLALSLLVVPALAAALIGFFRDFWATLAGGIAMGVMEGITAATPGLGEYRAAVPFLVILCVLLWSQRGVRFDDAR